MVILNGSFLKDVRAVALEQRLLQRAGERAERLLMRRAIHVLVPMIMIGGDLPRPTQRLQATGRSHRLLSAK
jgi:hypothetical protein